MVSRYDGFVLVTPEYNHSTSSVLKNALDTVYAEWNNKAAALVSYGAVGGVRAAEHLRQILAVLQVADIGAQLSFSLAVHDELHLKTAETMFTQLEAWAGALKALQRPTDG
jgi:NAD(P)H-dependent FMN reductase